MRRPAPILLAVVLVLLCWTSGDAQSRRTRTGSSRSRPAAAKPLPRAPASTPIPRAPAPAAQPQPVEPVSEATTIKVDVNLVTFTATVTDGYGRHLSRLRREDFALMEDGQPQAISLFHDEIVPVTVGIVIDTSGSMGDKMDQAAEALINFVQTIRPDDDVFLMRFSGNVELELDFTGNRELFASAARRLRPIGATRLYDALAEALEKVSHGRHRKKAIVLITDGQDTSSQLGFEEVLEMARQSEVLVYAMGIGRDDSSSFRARNRQQRREEGVDMRVLSGIADATGGRAFHLEHAQFGGADMIDRAAQEISAELRQQYTVGYYPTNPQRDGTFRRIDLRPRLAGVNVRHRRGYYAPRELAAETR